MRWSVRLLLIAASVLLVAAIFAVFANRQVLNADNWSDTSTQLLDDPAIRTQVSAFLVDQVYANVDVRGQVAQALPPRLAPLAGPAANGLRELAERRMYRLLDRPRVQQAWEQANKLTAEQFIAIAENKSKAITQNGNAVVLDLRVILIEFIDRLGLPSSLGQKIPASAGKIKIMSGNQVSTLQNFANALKGFALILPVLAFGMFALAVFLARENRRRALMFVGIDLILGGLIVLVARRMVGHSVVNSLASTESVRPAAESVWSIGTHMLRDVAGAVIITGIPVVFAAWLAGPTHAATSARRSIAPYLRERVGLTYGVVGTIVALVLAWGPIPATRKPIPVLIMIGLVILGVEVLRRQTAEEFPDVALGSPGAALRSGATRARAGVTGGATPPDADGMQARLDRLERLAELHDRGALTDEEFAAEKSAVGAKS